MYTKEMDKFNCSSTSSKTEMGSLHKDPNVFHFSHPHPLECTTSPSTENENATCFGCKLNLTQGENRYRCKTKTCAFTLHNVCYNMPLITNHPAHQNHDLVHLVIPSSKSTFNCVACGNHVKGFCYHCAECSIFFHALCLALPLSLAITNHPHKIKLEFSPPYDFFCDLCNKPSYNGWLFRCSMCEFDTHIACVVENMEPKLFHNNPSFPQSSPLLRQLTKNHQHQVDHRRFSNKEKNYEIMHLVAQQIGGGMEKISTSGTQEVFDGSVTGWDKRVYSPRKRHNRNSVIQSGNMKNIVELELQETELSHSPADFIKNSEERTPLRDKLTPLSDHSSPPQSNQYSDSYFSIDLTKSYSNYHNGRRTQIITRAAIPERIARDSQQVEEPFGVVEWPTKDSCTNNQNKVNAAFFKGGHANDFGEPSQKIIVKDPKESLAKRSIIDQKINKSQSDLCSHMEDARCTSLTVVFFCF
ncbi:hypothetical protein RJT34_20247 [Clitoria ternatea]|uniref:DC1 domain-containing protein n=1 Tax=Clitoria ternatea TaxID=43366 RepID=A0AAN9IT43_CLITE